MSCDVGWPFPLSDTSATLRMGERTKVATLWL